MSTIRVARRPRYTAIDRRTLNDEALSFRARGILVWLLDKPDDWQADAERIAVAGKEGRDAVRAALRELETGGYLVRRKYRGDDGRWVTEHTVYEHPSAIDVADQDGKPAVENQRRATSAGKSGPLEMTVETTETTPILSRDLDTATTLFEEFWSVVATKRGKPAARAAWDKAIKLADPGLIIEKMRAYRDDPNRDPAHTKYPQGWLTEHRWNDPPLPPRAPRRGTRPTRPNPANVSAVDEAYRSMPTGRLDLDVDP